MTKLESFPTPAREMIIQNYYNVADINLEPKRYFQKKRCKIRQTIDRYLQSKDYKVYTK